MVRSSSSEITAGRARTALSYWRHELRRFLRGGGTTKVSITTERRGLLGPLAVDKGRIGDTNC